jgi:type IV pilus assembly protein PilQ
MKKTLTIFLILLFSLTACGGKKRPDMASNQRDKGAVTNIDIFEEKATARNFTKDAKNFLDKSKNIMKDTNSRKASGPRRVSITPDVKKSDEELIIKDLNQHIKNLETIPVTLKFNSMNIRSALRLFAGLVKRNIVIGEEVNGNITLDFQDINWGSAVYVILDMNDLVMLEENQKKMVDNSKQLASLTSATQTTDAQTTATTTPTAETGTDTANQKTEIFKIFYNTSATIPALLQASVPGLGTVTDDVGNNQLIVTGTEEQLDQVEKVLETIDSPKKAIMIEAYIINAEDGFAKSFDANLVANSTLPGRSKGSNITTGIVSSNPGQTAIDNANVGMSGFENATLQGGMLLLGNIGRMELQAIINASVNDTNSETISNPKLFALDGQAASIRQGLNIQKVIPAADGAAASTQTIALDLNMNITPRIRGDKIEMLVDISNRSPGSSVAGVVSGDTPINSETVNSTVQIGDGGVAVLGGVYKNTKADSINFVPILSKIPILGSFFQTKTKSDTKNQLLIFITANIV